MPVLLPTMQGGISYKPPTFIYGDTSQQITGGFSFDLPLATAAMFTNTALDFSATNTKNAQGFFSGVLARQQASLDTVANKAFTYQGQALETQMTAFNSALDTARYAIKKKGGGGLFGGCFITTAVCKASGLPDDCAKLMALRKFRDNYLLKTEEGKKLVKEYYRIAPKIVALLDALPNAASHYNYLDCNFIDLALSKISTGDLEGAKGVYCAMVEVARNLSGYVETAEVVQLPQAKKQVPQMSIKVSKRNG